MTLLCDRCQAEYQPHPEWVRCPLARECLIAQRRTETIDGWVPRPLTRRELESAWRRALFIHLNSELTT